MGFYTYVLIQVDILYCEYIVTTLLMMTQMLCTLQLIDKLAMILMSHCVCHAGVTKRQEPIFCRKHHY
jgi:hypothetical protein